MLDVGCVFYKAWFYAKTQPVSTTSGICDNPSGCVYGQTVAPGYSQNIPLTLQPWAVKDWQGNPLSFDVYQLDPNYRDLNGNPYVNTTMWGWDTYTASFPGLTSVACSGPLTCTAVGAAQIATGIASRANYDSKSTILTTTDGGFSWKQYDFTAAAAAAPQNFTNGAAPTADLNKVFFNNDGTGWAVGGDYVGNNGVILETKDGGLTWHSTNVNQVQMNQIYQYEVIPKPAVATLVDTIRGYFPGADPTVATTLSNGYITPGQSVYIPASLCDGQMRSNGITYGALGLTRRSCPLSRAAPVTRKISKFLGA